MNYFKKGLLILLLPLVAFTSAHKFYVSVTNLVYVEKDNALQITSRIFIDDLEAVFKERYEVDAQLGTDNEKHEANVFIEKYLRTKFDITVNEKKADYDFIGKKYEDDIVVLYFEVPELNITDVKTIELTNEMLTDLYDEQQNIVHFKINDKKKSFVLTKENSVGAVNL